MQVDEYIAKEDKRLLKKADTQAAIWNTYTEDVAKAVAKRDKALEKLRDDDVAEETANSNAYRAARKQADDDAIAAANAAAGLDPGGNAKTGQAKNKKAVPTA